MSDMTTFRENLKRIRKSKSITLKELAEEIGVKEATVQRYESGAISNIPYDKVVAMANALRVTPAALMGWEDDIPDMDPLVDAFLDDSSRALLMTAASNKEFFELYEKLNDTSKEQLLNYARFLLSQQ